MNRHTARLYSELGHRGLPARLQLAKARKKAAGKKTTKADTAKGKTR